MNEEKTHDSLKESLEKKIADSYPIFLKALKKASPLAVLSSTCIAVAAFTHTTYPSATAYAITGASFFLVAFVFSLITEIRSFSPFAIYSYISIALGILMMFAFIMEFGRNIPMVGKIPIAILSIAGLYSYSIDMISIGNRERKSDSKAISWCGHISVVSGLICLVFGMTAMGLFTFTTETLVSTILGGFVAVFISTGIISSFLASYIKLKQAKREKQKPRTQSQ
jgi:hypothetical protein